MTSVEFVIWMRGFLAGCPLEMDGSSAPIGKWRTQLLRDQVGLVDGVPMPREKRTNLRTPLPLLPESTESDSAGEKSDAS